MSFDPYEFDRSMHPSGTYTLGQYTAKTFLWMMLGLLVTFGVAAIGYATDLTWVLYRDIPGLHLILLVATLILSITMVSRIERMSVTSAVVLFVAFSALFGLTLSLYMYVFQMTSFILIFLLTALYFGALAAYGYLTKADLIGIVVFLGYTAYDTQRIQAFYSYYSGYPDMLEKASIFSALQLYLDFINLFLYLLRFMGRRK